jgi:hypothetical protein
MYWCGSSKLYGVNDMVDFLAYSQHNSPSSLYEYVCQAVNSFELILFLPEVCHTPLLLIFCDSNDNHMCATLLPFPSLLSLASFRLSDQRGTPLPLTRNLDSFANV